MLIESCSAFFNKLDRNIKPIFLDSVEDSSTLFADEENVDIVFFGGIIQKLFQLPLYNFKHARFWCLSSTYRDILIKEFNFPPDCVSLIPRDNLFPKSKSITPFSLTRDSNFVYAGRISAPKNIIALLKLVSKLQLEHDLPVGLSIYGSFDDEQNFDERPQFRKSYREQVLETVRNLNWTNNPVFHGETQESDWPQRTKDDSIFVNFSKYYQEDFGVSLAQWEELGRPSLISNWGGHRDTYGENVFKIPPHLIPERDEPTHIVDLKIDRLANYILNPKNAAISIQDKDFYVSTPSYLPKQQIIGGVLKTQDKIGQLGNYIENGQWGLLSSTHQGQNFLNNIKLHFSRETIRKTDAVVICNWFECSQRAETKNVREQILHLTNDLNDIEYIYFRDIHLSESINRMLLSKKIIFPYFIVEMLDTIQSLCKDAEAYPPVTIVLDPTQQHLLPKLKQYTRTIDQIIF